MSVAAPVLLQWAACPMYVSPPRVKMKLAVHWPEPSVSVWMPGWIVAESAGAHADAAAGVSAATPVARPWPGWPGCCFAYELSR